MFINEIEEGTVVTIRAEKEGHAMTFVSKTMGVSEKDFGFLEVVGKKIIIPYFVIIEQVLYEKQPINFIGEGIVSECMAVVKESPYKWPNVKVARLQLPEEGWVHVIFTNEDVRSFNRRSEFRVPLDCRATVKLGGTTSFKDAILKDISPHGFGFVIDSEQAIEVGDKVELQFRESETVSKSGDSISILYSTNGTVVRVVKMDEKRNLIGCRVGYMNSDISRFIINKQAKRVKGLKKN